MSRSKFTAENRDLLTRYLQQGNTQETACRMVGIHKSQLYRWLNRGENAREGTAFRDFYDAMQRAEGEAETRAQLYVQQGMKNDPKWTAWYLERRHPEQWGKRMWVERNAEPIGPIVVKLELPSMPSRPRSTIEQLPAG